MEGRSRRIVSDSARILRRARALQAELAPSLLSEKELETWGGRNSLAVVPGPTMQRGIHAERRLAPEASTFDDRMNAVLLKYANIPLGSAGDLVLSEYWNVLDVAAEAVEQTAYPGTIDARKRYALAFRRCARELRNVSNLAENGAGKAMWRAHVTLQLSLDDGTLALWDSSQALVDFVGRRSDGTSQDAGGVSSDAWAFIWDYAVVSRLRQTCPRHFEGVAENRGFMADEEGRPLDEKGRPLLWVWDGMGSGLLEADAAINSNAEDAFRAAMEETGLTRLISGPNWADSYRGTTEHHAFCGLKAVEDFFLLRFFHVYCSPPYSVLATISTTK
jgi:hypothetical protein